MRPAYYVVTVSEVQRECLTQALRAPALAEVFPEVLGAGYTGGSTEWSVLVRSPSTEQRMRDVLYQRGVTWCTARPATPAEVEGAL